MSINKPQTLIVGNLAADPELRFTPSGQAVAKMRVAMTPRVKDGDSWKDGEPLWANITVWRDLAEHVAESLKKGDRVIAWCEMTQRSYEKDGVTRTVVEYEAEAIGPELRFATTVVTRTKGGNGGSRSSGGDDAWGGASKERPAAPVSGEKSAPNQSATPPSDGW
jgi:single-strand DNA-binding protein